MMNFGVCLVVFLLAAGLERLWETGASRRAVRGEKRQPWTFFVFLVLQVAIYALTAVEYFALRRPVVWPVTAAALVVFLLATWVRLVAVRTLGKYWSLHLEIRSDHQFITEGIYRYLRHPAYAAIMAEVVSVPLVGNAYYTALFALLTYVPLLLFRWRREEVEMIAKFGEPYRRYCREVPAFLPWRGALRGAHNRRFNPPPQTGGSAA
ncbi:MAG: isoprenylcysteine carboxylmethyltransferase family protein [Verrucomicrobia bacterium]|nr:isoprenylcysteine carboxylmethyltransferase family protein [Verrucomicrobiota bacterium]